MIEFNNLIGNGIIKPDPDRLRPLQELPPPTSVRSLRRSLSMFAYYAKWIPDFSEKIKPLTSTQSFPLSQSALNAFTVLKKELAAASLVLIDESMPFVVECHASDTTLSVVDLSLLCPEPCKVMSCTTHL